MLVCGFQAQKPSPVQDEERRVAVTAQTEKPQELTSGAGSSLTGRSELPSVPTMLIQLAFKAFTQNFILCGGLTP